jgi:HK97 gp10 family phage protein
MSVDFDFSQVRALGSRIKTSGGRVGAAASAALRKTAFDIEADAKALAPVASIETSGYVGGNLRNSISTTIEGDGRHGLMTVEIGPTADYGIYQEYGTSTQPGTPFMGPAFDRRVPGYTEALARLDLGF